MQAATKMKVWLFVFLVLFCLCTYFHQVWTNYTKSIEKRQHQEELFDLIDAVQESFTDFKYEDAYKYQLKLSKLKLNSFLKIPTSDVGKILDSAVRIRSSNKSTASSNPASIVRKSQGSPRFPNIHQPFLEFDSKKHICDDDKMLSSDCAKRTSEFKELLLKEFHRVLMEESKVFSSGLDVHNTYDVKYDNTHRKDGSREEVLCALKRVQLNTVSAEDEPFARLGYKIPGAPLRAGHEYNTCAVVTSAGALLGSKLGEFIDSHDMVLRFNDAPTDNYTEDVGTKTTFRVLNSQVVAKPEYKFLEDPLYDNVSILVWDPANYSSTLEDWYYHPDYPLFPVYKMLLDHKPKADVHLLNPQVLWTLWSVLQDTSTYRLRRNPPSSGFIGLWFSVHRCRRVRVLEYVPSARASRRCHYYAPRNDTACTFGTWHPLAHEKRLAERLRDNNDVQVFQRGIIDIPGVCDLTCA